MTATPGGPPRPRERVVLAHRHGARTVRTRVEVQEQTGVGDVMIRALVRAQLGLALRVAAAVVLVAAVAPLLLWALPPLAAATLFEIRVSWLLLAVAVYPALYLVGRIHIRLAERLEQEFVDLADD